MIVGIDVDGTITKHPELFRALTRGLKAEGHTIYIITCRLEKEYLREELDAYDICFDEVYMPPPEKEQLTVGEWKASVCEDHDVDVLFEDSPDVLRCLPDRTKGVYVM